MRIEVSCEEMSEQIISAFRDYLIKNYDFYMTLEESQGRIKLLRHPNESFVFNVEGKEECLNTEKWINAELVESEE